ncbi:hypothetical protein [uncultured Formosa sp.]|uniref:hypothetical protein n=1 Tax=uncultured Formosa sp. TaxID=255435 RepID=UPI00260C46B7|nr:hypothetical protein [uncultured Formosa sp.]
MSIVFFQFMLPNDVLQLIIDNGIIIGLLITVFIFLVLLILGMRKTQKLNAENERLANSEILESDDKDKKYKDFTEGHLYSNN